MINESLSIIGDSICLKIVMIYKSVVCLVPKLTLFPVNIYINWTYKLLYIGQLSRQSANGIYTKDR